MTTTDQVRLWLDNDEPSYRQAVEYAQQAVDHPTPNEFMDADARVRHAAQENLKAWVEREVYDALEAVAGATLGGSLIREFVTSELGAIDWYELADVYIEAVECEA